MICIRNSWMKTIKHKKEWLRYSTALWARRCSCNVGRVGKPETHIYIFGLNQLKLLKHSTSRQLGDLLQLIVTISILKVWSIKDLLSNEVRSADTEAPFWIIFMPPTSKKLSGHIGLSMSVVLCVCASVTLWIRSRTVRDRILKFNTWNLHEK